MLASRLVVLAITTQSWRRSKRKRQALSNQVIVCQAVPGIPSLICGICLARRVGFLECVSQGRAQRHKCHAPCHPKLGHPKRGRLHLRGRPRPSQVIHVGADPAAQWPCRTPALVRARPWRHLTSWPAPRPTLVRVRGGFVICTFGTGLCLCRCVCAVAFVCLCVRVPTL